MALTPKHPTITPSRTRAQRSAGALAFAASFVLLAGFTAAACGGNSNAGSTPGGHAASANGGEGDGTGSGGSSASNTGGSSGSSHTSGGSSSTSGGTSSASGGSDAAGGDATGGTTSDTGGSTSSGGTTAGGTSSGGSSATGATGGTTTTGSACDNGLDDDGDGLIDGFDPECTGPWDNDEGSFATGIPGDNSDPKWQDCFFDGNSGAGDDGCRYPTQCLTGDYDAADPKCELANACKDYCAKLTPNGCDCFGCCTVQGADGTSVDIFTTSSCSIDKIDDEAACPRCQKSLDCQNTCGECELCPGKTEADLPASCTPPPTTGTGGSCGTGGSSGTGGSGGTGSGGTDSGTGGTGTGGTGGTDSGTGGTGGTDTPPPPTHTCEGGLTVCGPGLPSCEGGMYCQQGCCMFVVR